MVEFANFPIFLTLIFIFYMGWLKVSPQFVSLKNLKLIEDLANGQGLSAKLVFIFFITH